jgi:hypothetical protein
MAFQGILTVQAASWKCLFGVVSVLNAQILQIIDIQPSPIWHFRA